LNHFPGHEHLTRKDTMVKNIKAYIKDLEKENHPLAEKDEEGRFIHLDIIPTTYIFPQNYSTFEQEFKKNPKTIWIMKPAGRS
jgi:tubulin polyglutamylase TTLL1